MLWMDQMKGEHSNISNPVIHFTKYHILYCINIVPFASEFNQSDGERFFEREEEERPEFITSFINTMSNTNCNVRASKLNTREHWRGKYVDMRWADDVGNRDVCYC